jgi:type I restriction enzyme M protein
VEAKYAREIERETARLEAAIAAAKKAKDTDHRKAAQKELAEYLARMDETKTRESRAALKERFDYPIFLYDAEKVGITATGEGDTNELYTNADLPAGAKPEDTCLELYRRFVAKPRAFVMAGGEA